MADGWLSYACCALAPMFAVLFTNPFDVAKVRLQLQGELTSLNRAERKFKGPFDCLKKTVKHEGFIGLQKGLVPALVREGSRNFFRLGLFEPLFQGLQAHTDPNTGILWKRMLAGAVSGAIGSFVCNPFELVKTQMQAQSVTHIATGHQHNVGGLVQGLQRVVHKAGIPGLFKGTKVNILRALVGSSITLTTYSTLKDAAPLVGMRVDSMSTHTGASFLSAVATVVFMHPLDVIRTRVYNQPVGPDGSGLLYRGTASAAYSIWKREGAHAFYKGAVAHFLRIGPHCMLTFVFLEQLTRLARELRNK